LFKVTAQLSESAKAPVLLEGSGLAMRFGSIEVLSGVSIAFEAGKVHAIIGENGAGKSTLMKTLGGYLQPTRGTLASEGKPIQFRTPVDAEKHGIVLVHQEILLAPHLTVAQNIFLGREIWRGFALDDKEMNRRASLAVADLGATIDPHTLVERLSIAQRQLVQIARALSVPHKVVIFDEPTASLTPIETDALLAVINRIKARGVAVLYISHRLPEVKTIADQVTVLRDGKLIITCDANGLEPIDMAKLMVGRDMGKLYPPKAPLAGGDILLEVNDYQVPGFAGLVGAGRTELFEGLLGLRSGSGSVEIDGKFTKFANARQGMDAGIVYLSEDRKGKGLLLAQPLGGNLTLAALDRFSCRFMIDAAKERDALDRAISEFDIRARSKTMLAGQLSGGNQQKLFLAKMMLLNPRVVIIDEPTRGVDIGAKEQIYSFIAALAVKGIAVIVISSEMQELIGVCHRVLVMRNGRIVGEVGTDNMSEDEIVILATGAKPEEAAAAH
jgi:ribose transport system ATP-binding protein